MSAAVSLICFARAGEDDDPWGVEGRKEDDVVTSSCWWLWNSADQLSHNENVKRIPINHFSDLLIHVIDDDFILNAIVQLVGRGSQT